MKKAELKILRSRFREGVFKRDQNKCRICGKSGNLDAHHITDRHEMPNDGYAVSNGISLCTEPDGGCHMLAEQWHISGGKNWHPGLHPDDLYRIIGASKERALADCQALRV